jgi:hypothetical protein
MTRDGKGEGGDDRGRWGKDVEVNKNSFQCFFFLGCKGTMGQQGMLKGRVRTLGSMPSPKKKKKRIIFYQTNKNYIYIYIYIYNVLMVYYYYYCYLINI